MALPNLKFAPYIQPFVGEISEETGQAVKQRLAQYYEAQNTADALGYATHQLKNQTLPQYKFAISSIADKFNNKLQEYVTKGDYENLGRAIKMDARAFETEATPFLQQKALYNDYLKQINDAKDISQERKDLAIKKSLENYKGYDPNNPNSSFKGYIPSKDVNIADKISDFTKDFKADGSTYEIPDYRTGIKTKVSSKTNQDTIKYNKNGKTVELYIDDNTGGYNLDGIGRPITQIEYAARNYALGDKDIQEYGKSENILTGDNTKFNRELTASIQAAMTRDGFTEISKTTDIDIPTSVKYMQEIAELNKPAETSTAGFFENKFLTEGFESSRFNTVTGKLQHDTDRLIVKDGIYNKIIDPYTKKEMTVQEYKDYILRPTGFGGDLNTADDLRKMPELVPISKEEQNKIEQQQNQKFDKLVELAALSQANLLYPKQGQNQFQHQFAQNNYLLINKNKLADPGFRQQVLNEYEKSRKQYQNVEVPMLLNKNNSAVKIFGEGSNILANISNRVIHINQENESIGIKNSDLQGKNSFQSLEKQLGDKGWSIENATEVGKMFYNPQGQNPATQVTLNLVNKDEKKKAILNISAETSDEDSNANILKEIEKAGKAIISGESQIIPVGDSYLEVNAIPLGITGEGQGMKVLVREMEKVGDSYTPLYDKENPERGQYQPAIKYLHDAHKQLFNLNILNYNSKK